VSPGRAEAISLSVTGLTGRHNRHRVRLCGGGGNYTGEFMGALGSERLETVDGATRRHLRRIRIWLAVMMVGLVASGLTAFPLETEIRWLLGLLRSAPLVSIAQSSGLLPWIARVYEGVRVSNAQYPFLAYGTDWLAFAHLAIAVLFIGPFRDPVGNKWVITFGLIACAGIIPLATIAGPIRGIPMGWRLIDCSFGVFGAIPLLMCRRETRAIERGRG
jgi:hypothetical protein